MDIPGLLHLVIGLTLLSFGHKLFWLFVGCVGFAAGYSYAQVLLSFESRLLVLFLALLIGFGGALVAFFLQRLSIGLSGFLGGGYVALNTLPLLGISDDQLVLLAAILGGIIGAVLLYLLFDWALIFLSSVVGALLVVQAVSFKPEIEVVVFLALFTAGALIQAKLKRGDKTIAKPS